MTHTTFGTRDDTTALTHEKTPEGFRYQQRPPLVTAMGVHWEGTTRVGTFRRDDGGIATGDSRGTRWDGDWWSDGLEIDHT